MLSVKFGYSRFDTALKKVKEPKDQNYRIHYRVSHRMLCIFRYFQNFMVPDRYLDKKTDLLLASSSGSARFMFLILGS